MSFWNKNKNSEKDVSEKEVDPFDYNTLGWEKYESDEMKNAREEIRFAHIRENAEEFIDGLEELMMDHNLWDYGNIQLDFKGMGFSIYDDEDVVKYLKEAEKVAGVGTSRSMKSNFFLKSRPADPELFWLSLHDHYDLICKELSKGKMWSTSFIVEGRETPMLFSVKEFDIYLEDNKHPKIKWQHTSQTKSVSMSGNPSSTCLTKL